MANWLDKINYAHQDLLRVSFALNDLALSFERCGNDKISTELSDYALYIRESIKQVDHAISEELNFQVNESQKAICQTFQAIIEKSEQNNSAG